MTVSLRAIQIVTSSTDTTKSAKLGFVLIIVDTAKQRDVENK